MGGVRPRSPTNTENCTLRLPEEPPFEHAGVCELHRQHGLMALLGAGETKELSVEGWQERSQRQPVAMRTPSEYWQRDCSTWQGNKESKQEGPLSDTLRNPPPLLLQGADVWASNTCCQFVFPGKCGQSVCRFGDQALP